MVRTRKNGDEVVRTKDRTEALGHLGKLIRTMGRMGIRASHVKDAEEIILRAIRECGRTPSSAPGSGAEGEYERTLETPENW